ncbi:Mdm33 family-domain-containing protein [Russula earlei]|uniref:Mdm33 family-domain-containing protein n=1 Tax=Russula earlei TaxID=71964 RepID=A0ACC0UMC3_9AGAM|nr:Mdm33 family-domain-containing protein [Russula earlei]
MLRLGASRLLLATSLRVHVRLFATASPLKQDRGLRPSPNGPPSESAPDSTPPSSSSGPESGKNIEHAQSLIRRWSERNSVAFRQHTDNLIARMAVSFTRLGGEINRVTGYDEIETLKRQVVSQEARISASRKAARDAKEAYERAVQRRSDSQREVNGLLERKSMWTDADVSRFTALVRQDHTSEQEEARAKATVAQTEDEVDRAFDALMRTILARYHEEQVWSDKIRSVSTYGQLGVLGVNVLVFVLAIALVEPWRRRRLAQAFERKVQAMEEANLDAVSRGLDALRSRLDGQDEILARLAVSSSSSSVAHAPVARAQEQRMPDAPAAAAAGGGRPAVVEFAGFALAHEDAKLIAASMSAGMLAWAFRGWMGS